MNITTFIFRFFSIPFGIVVSNLSVIELLPAFAQPDPYKNFNVTVGVVRKDVGYVVGYGSKPSQTEYLGSFKWDWCPSGMSLAGRLKQSNDGVWVCLREGYGKSREFFVGVGPNGSTISNNNPFHSVVIGKGLKNITAASEFGSCEPKNSRLLGLMKTYGTWACERNL
jgi:hypothetical protein